MSALTHLSLRVRGSRLGVGLRNAVLSMRMRRWLRAPEPRKVRIDHYARRLATLETGFGSERWWVADDDGWPREDDDGLAGSRIPRRPVLDPGSASATLTFDEYDDRSHGWAPE